MNHSISRHRLAALATVLLASLSGFAQAQDAPPTAPVRAVTTRYFGTDVVDNYRYMEDLPNPEVQAWMKAQADYTRQQLDALPGRTTLLERIHALSNADTQRSGFVRRGQRYFYQMVEPGAQQPRLFYRDGLDGEEHLLIDPGSLGKGGSTHYAMDYFEPSFDGRYLAYGLSAGGSEASVLHVLEVSTGKLLPEAITRADESVVSWRPDNRSFYYMRFNKRGPNTPPAETLYNARAYLHTLGSNADGEGDALLFGHGVSSATVVPEGEGAYLITGSDSHYVVAMANHNMDDAPGTFFVAPADKIKGAATPWRQLAAVDDGITAVELRADKLFFLSQKGASRYRILATSLAKPDVAHAEVIVPEGSGVITHFALAREGIYYRVRSGAISKLMLTTYDGKSSRAVPLPFEGDVFGPTADSHETGALFNMQSWTHAPQLYSFDAAQDKLTLTALIPPSKLDTTGLESREVWVTSYDGTRVPLSIIYPKGTKLDGSHPTILAGYGGYGISLEAGFRPTWMAWLEQGGIMAVAHVRGGGELGEDWHRGSLGRTKINTILDFIACGQYLVDQRYTQPKLLAGNGGSAGGITVGGAMTWRPDLFGVILDQVGQSDTLRVETEPNGPPNVIEMGSASTEDGFHGLYAMSAYEHLRDGVAYPAVMYTTGANDPRVAPWHMLKMAARTQAASSSGRPALLRVDYDAGHGIGSNRSQREVEQADMWSFALWQMGAPGFQPKAKP